MASAKRSTVTALIMLVAVSSIILPAAHAGRDFISSTCSKTKNATACVAILGADPRSLHASTKHELAAIALQIAIDIIYNNVKIINDLLDKKEHTPEEGALEACHKAYLDADNDVELQARLAFDDQEYADASKVLLLAKGTGDICEKAFKGISKESPITDIDRKMTEGCGVAADLMDLLVPK